MPKRYLGRILRPVDRIRLTGPEAWWTVALGATAAGLMVWLLTIRGREGDSSEVDVASLQRSLGDLSGGGSLRLRELGRGIIEVVGTAPDEASAREVLARLAGEPGVEVVVNRVWASPSPEAGAPS